MLVMQSAPEMILSHESQETIPVHKKYLQTSGDAPIEDEQSNGGGFLYQNILEFERRNSGSKNDNSTRLDSAEVPTARQFSNAAVAGGA